MAGRTPTHHSPDVERIDRLRKPGAFLILFGLLLSLFAVVADATVVGPGSATGFEIEGNQVDDTAADPPFDWVDALGVADADSNDDAGELTIISDQPEHSGLVQGSDEQNPAGFTCTDHGNPPKDDILQVAINERISPAAAYLDLAVVRASGNGNTHVNFEFNQNPMSLPCDGTPGLHTRTQDDLLLLLEFPGNGTAVVNVYRWDEPPAANDSDNDGQWILDPTLPNGIATGAENAVALTAAQNPLFGGAVPDRAFAEVSVDLGAILHETPGSTECHRFGSVSVRSRASGESITSELKDLVGPNPINLSTCGGVTLHKTDDAGNPLPNATFGLYATHELADTRSAANAVATCLSTATGLCDFGEVAPGSYFVAEISAPPGYNIDPDIVPVSVVFRTTTDIALPFVDPRQVGYVRVDKTLVSTSGASLTPDNLADLNGATFVLRQNNQVSSLWPDPPTNDPATCTISNSEGFCVIGPVPIGTYEVLETAAPPGTTPGTQPGNVTVTEGTTAQAALVSYPNVSETPTITISKTATPTEVLEPGGNVVFNLVITNTSNTETLNLDSLVDDVFGDLFDAANPLVSNNTCADLQDDDLAPKAFVGCSFSALVSGNAGDPDHHDTVTVVGSDDEGQTATDDDDATVRFDELGSIEVTKDADPGQVDEPGGPVTFTVTIQNTSDVRTITIETINDNVFGDLGSASNALVSDNGCVDLIGDQLAPSASTSCTFVADVEGLAVPGDDSEHEDTVTVTGQDDQHNPVEDADDAVVDIVDVPPVVTVSKTADDNSIPENTPTPIEFTVVVTNGSVEPVTITSLVDDVFGVLAGDDDCKVGIELPVGGSCQFTFVEVLEGDAAGPDHTNTVTVVVTDTQGNTDDDDDPETVVFEDVPPTILVDKTASPTSVPENTPTEVEFDVTVTNTSNEAVTITSLADDVFGPLEGDPDCQVGTVLAAAGEAGDSCTFSFTGEVVGDASGAPHVDTVTAVVVDDDGTEGQDDDPAEVTFTDVPPTVEVTKESDTGSIADGSSAQVTFTVVVTNTSDEAVTITSLTDSVFGTLVGDADCQVGTVLAAAGEAGDSCTFEFVKTVAGDIDAPHTNVVTVEVVDDDGTPGVDDDDETIPVTSTTTTTIATTSTTGAEVLGVQQTRELPRTGSESLRLLLGSIGMLAVGAGFVMLAAYTRQRRYYQF